MRRHFAVWVETARGETAPSDALMAGRLQLAVLEVTGDARARTGHLPLHLFGSYDVRYGRRGCRLIRATSALRAARKYARGSLALITWEQEDGGHDRADLSANRRLRHYELGLERRCLSATMAGDACARFTVAGRRGCSLPQGFGGRPDRSAGARQRALDRQRRRWSGHARA